MLAADAGVSDEVIASSLSVGRSTVYRPRRRFVQANLDLALSEESRPGTTRKLSGKETVLLIATACSSPPQGRKRWTLDLAADRPRCLAGRARQRFHSRQGRRGNLPPRLAGDAASMKRQPGFISTQLHRAVGHNPTYLNYAVWESTAAFRAAFTHPEFAAKLSTYPSSAVAMPHLFQKVAVPDICVA